MDLANIISRINSPLLGEHYKETSAQLNKTPFKAIDYNHPRDQFALLAQ